MQIILLLLMLFTAGWAQPDAGENSGNKSDFGARRVDSSLSAIRRVSDWAQPSTTPPPFTAQVAFPSFSSEPTENRW